MTHLKSFTTSAVQYKNKGVTCIHVARFKSDSTAKGQSQCETSVGLIGYIIVIAACWFLPRGTGVLVVMLTDVLFSSSFNLLTVRTVYLQPAEPTSSAIQVRVIFFQIVRVLN